VLKSLIPLFSPLSNQKNCNNCPS